MKCPLCESDNTQVLPTFIMCVDCGCNTAALFTPSGEETNLPELLNALWHKRVMGFRTPLGEVPKFTWTKNEKWTVKIDLSPEPFVYLETPEEGIDFLIAGFQIEQSIAPTRQEHIEQLFKSELAKGDTDWANERYLERMNRDLNWTAAVEAMNQL